MSDLETTKYDSICQMWICYFDPIFVKYELNNEFININFDDIYYNNLEIFNLNFHRVIIDYNSIEYKENILNNNFISWWIHMYESMFYRCNY